jgi:hypothetical protein
MGPMGPLGPRPGWYGWRRRSSCCLLFALPFLMLPFLAMAGFWFHWL